MDPIKDEQIPELDKQIIKALIRTIATPMHPERFEASLLAILVTAHAVGFVQGTVNALLTMPGLSQMNRGEREGLKTIRDNKVQQLIKHLIEEALTPKKSGTIISPTGKIITS